MVIFYLIYIGLIIFSNYQQVDCISCKGRDGNVEWFLIVKPPAREMSGGKGYLYKSKVPSNSLWTYVKGDLMADDLPVRDLNQIHKVSPIGWTLYDVFLNPSEYQYILYNNEIPKGIVAQTLSPKDKSKKFGSGKGENLSNIYFTLNLALIWDKVGGSAIFIVHSAGNFLKPITNDLRRHFSRQNYDSNGHSFLCVNLPLDAVETIMKHLIIIKALVYDYSLTTIDNWDKLERSQMEIYGESDVISRMLVIQGSDLTKIGYRGSHPSISSRGFYPSIPSISSRSSKSSVHSSRKSSSFVVPSKPNGGKSTIIKERIDPNSDSLIAIGESTNLRIISKSFKEPGGIWKKINPDELLFFIKPHSSLSLSRPCSKIIGTRVETDHAAILPKQIHWNYNEDKFNFGFYRDIKTRKFIYCHTDIEDKSIGRIGRSLGGSRAGLALCLQGEGANDLTLTIKNTAVESCKKNNR